ncbi:hypothetical protein, partial [Legionella taurinensis]|uniref:hypothetical protein n=1 Tax=Legionella taurinensis TaxID=70611 RepID=UPI001B7D76E5
GVPCVFLVCLCAPIVAYAAVSSRPARNPDSPVAAMAPPPGSLRTVRRSQPMTPLRTDLP